MLDEFSDIEDKVEQGRNLGTYLGCCAGVIATVWGGYEIGTAINDFVGIEEYIGRGILDFFTMATIAPATICISSLAGFFSGGVLGYISHPIVETAYWGYNFLTRN